MLLLQAVFLESVRGDVSCGAGSLRVENIPYKGVFDEKVHGISGSWEDGCKSCGDYLELNGLIHGGWRCEKSWNWGIWLKRDPLTMHNAEWRDASAMSFGDWSEVFRDDVNIADTTMISNWARVWDLVTDELTGIPSLSLSTTLQPWRALSDGLNLDIKQGADTKIIIHGFQNDGSRSSTTGWRYLEEYGKSGFEGNLLALDWGNWAAAHVGTVNIPFHYPSAAENARTLGLMMAGFLGDFMDRYEIEASQLHCVGFSLGAQMCGYIGRTLITHQDAHLGRITALDPAGPHWTGASDRVTKNDASFVDAIHTNGANSPRGVPTDWLGNLEPSGHMDFYVNGGEYQPDNSCGPKSWTNGCHHGMANDVFIYSINHAFAGSLCWTAAVEDCISQGEGFRLDPVSPLVAPFTTAALAQLGEHVTQRTDGEIPWTLSTQTDLTRAYFVFVSQTDTIDLFNEWSDPMAAPVFGDQEL